MQTVIQVISAKPRSLRDKIVNDKKLARFGLVVAEQKRQARAPGWAKLHMPGQRGAINIQWHGASRTLICRIVTRSGKPDAIAGAFTSYLLSRLSQQIQLVQVILPPKNR
ncbi:MAG: hypothetical protein ACREIF_08920 [Chthoniobacterales bacterium]